MDSIAKTRDKDKARSKLKKYEKVQTKNNDNDEKGIKIMVYLLSVLYQRQRCSQNCYYNLQRQKEHAYYRRRQLKIKQIQT